MLHLKEGYTALAWASGRGNIASVLALVRLGARVDIENKVIIRLRIGSVDGLSYLSAAALQDGDTALILAVKFEHTSIVQALLDAGANQSDLSSVRSYLQGHRALNSTHYSRLICVPVDRADSHPRCEIARHAGVSHQLRYVHARTCICPAHSCVSLWCPAGHRSEHTLQSTASHLRRAPARR
jgi:hypothetical protein